MRRSNFSATLRNMEQKQPNDQAQRSRRWRAGVKERLDQIQAELGEQRQQLTALTELLGVELTRSAPTTEHRR